MVETITTLDRVSGGLEQSLEDLCQCTLAMY